LVVEVLGLIRGAAYFVGSGIGPERDGLGVIINGLIVIAFEIIGRCALGVGFGAVRIER
jgi:hypothetical protein